MGTKRDKEDWITTLENLARTPEVPEGWISTTDMAIMYDVPYRTMMDRLMNAERRGEIESIKIKHTRYWPGPDADYKPGKKEE